jgi:hypothetical protein
MNIRFIPTVKEVTWIIPIESGRASEIGLSFSNDS